MAVVTVVTLQPELSAFVIQATAKKSTNILMRFDQIWQKQMPSKGFANICDVMMSSYDVNLVKAYAWRQSGFCRHHPGPRAEIAGDRDVRDTDGIIYYLDLSRTKTLKKRKPHKIHFIHSSHKEIQDNTCTI